LAAAEGGGSNERICHSIVMRHVRCTLRRIDRLLPVPLFTIGRKFKAFGPVRLKQIKNTGA
jgi:hypothetical protein